MGLSLCLGNPVPRLDLNYSAAVRVRTGLGSWQTSSTPCAGDVVFSEFLPVLELRKDGPGAPSHAFFLIEEHAGGERFARLQPGRPCSPPVCNPPPTTLLPFLWARRPCPGVWTDVCQKSD